MITSAGFSEDWFGKHCASKKTNWKTLGVFTGLYFPSAEYFLNDALSELVKGFLILSLNRRRADIL